VTNERPGTATSIDRRFNNLSTPPRRCPYCHVGHKIVGKTELIKFCRWRGNGTVLDVTNQAAVDWFSGRLRQFSKEFGVDSFKFDAGEVTYLPPRMRTATPLHNLNRYTTLYVNMAANFGRMIEVWIAILGPHLLGSRFCRTTPC